MHFMQSTLVTGDHPLCRIRRTTDRFSHSPHICLYRIEHRGASSRHNAYWMIQGDGKVIPEVNVHIITNGRTSLSLFTKHV